MKSVKVKVPDNKVSFFLELMDDLKFKTKVNEKPKEKNVIKDIEKEFKKLRMLSKEKVG
ncbi:MAG: hypothetical protein RL060_1953 [Bacteroidota bacterium]|jgi:hypothetical protein